MRPCMPGLQRLQEFARRDGGHIAFALELLLLRVHRVGHVDREHDLGIDRNGAARSALRQNLRTGRRGDAGEDRGAEHTGSACNKGQGRDQACDTSSHASLLL